LDEEGIKKEYGSPVPRFNAVKWPIIEGFYDIGKGPYMVFGSYFGSAKAFVVLKAVECMN